MSRATEAGVRALYGIFVVWSAVGLVVMPLNPTVQELQRWTFHRLPDPLLDSLLYYADAIWLWLGASCTFVELVRRAGLSSAVSVTLLLGSAATLLEALGAATGWPFGPYVYSNRLGYKVFGLVPVSIPAAWFLIIINAHHVAGRTKWRPLLVGLIAVLTDLCLEIAAWHIRSYWTWYPGQSMPRFWPPAVNFLSWFLIAAGLDYCLLRKIPTGTSRAFPLALLTLMNVLFLLAILVFYGARPHAAV